MLVTLYALIPVLTWGTWLIPSQRVRFPSLQVKNFYVTGAVLLVSSGVLAMRGISELLTFTPGEFFLIFAGGIIWSLGSLSAFNATARIGTARAYGIWAPLNIIISMVWGAILFNEFSDISIRDLFFLLTALAVIIGGVLLIIFSSEKKSGTNQANGKTVLLGFAGAIGAGILWGSYFIPIQLADVSMWSGSFPLALGMFAGSSLLVLLMRQSVKLDSAGDMLRTALTGVMWTAGNYGMLLLVGLIGAGRGFTIAQLNLVVNALVSIFFLKEPQPKTRAAWLVLGGCFLATVGAILLGNLQ